MKTDIAFSCDSIEITTNAGRVNTQIYGVYKSDVMDSVLDVLSADEVLEAIDYDKIIDYLEEKYDIEKIRVKRWVWFIRK